MPLSVNSYAGKRFMATIGNYTGTVDFPASYTETATSYSFATRIEYVDVVITVSKDNPGMVNAQIPSLGTSYSGRKLNHEPGILAGQGLLLVKQ